MIRSSMKKFLFCFFSVIIAYVMQVTLFSFWEIGGIRPNLMIMLTCIVGFTMGAKPGLLVGFFSGLLVDLMAGGSVGFSALVFMYIGSVNGFFYKDYVKEELFLPLALVVGGTFIYEFFYYVFHFMLQNKLRLSFYLARIILPEVIYTMVVTLVMYIFIYYIIRKVQQKKRRRAAGSV